jgi:hypothetical protein
MTIVGHFDSLAEAQKLVQSELLAGVIQEVYEEGQLLQRLPVTTINSKSLLYNRESALPSAAFFDVHEQIPWSADQTFSQKEVSLKIAARQDVLDKFMLKTYKNPNDYRAIILSSLRKGCMRTLEDKIIYGDDGADAAEFDGLIHLMDTAIAGSEAFSAATNLQAYDMGGGSTAVTMLVIRRLIDAVRPRPAFLLMTRTMRNTLSATAFEKGLVLANTNSVRMGGTANDFGARVDYFDGIPIVISDYLGGTYGETDNTMHKATSASGLSSIWAIRPGRIEEGGLSLVTGGETGGVDFFAMEEFDKLEDYDAGGIRLTAYMCLAQGSSKATAVIQAIDEDQPMIG